MYVFINPFDCHQVPSMELLQPGMELLTNSDLTEVTVEGDNRTNLEILVRKIGYANTREFPTPGRRNLRLTTTVTCDSGKTIKVSQLKWLNKAIKKRRK